MPVAHVNGTGLSYEDHGAGRPLVFLHGWGTSGRVWDAQTADLGRDHRVITVDWRGCGRSERPTTGYTIADVTHDTLEFLDALELDAPVLIGSSIAGAFVLEAALAAPRRIGAVIPVDAGVHHFAADGMREAMAELLAGLRTDRARALAAFVPHWYRPGTDRAVIDRTVRRLLDSTPSSTGSLPTRRTTTRAPAWAGSGCRSTSSTANGTPRSRRRCRGSARH